MANGQAGKAQGPGGPRATSGTADTSYEESKPQNQLQILVAEVPPLKSFSVQRTDTDGKKVTVGYLLEKKKSRTRVVRDVQTPV